jgi:hypothetical protein
MTSPETFVTLLKDPAHWEFEGLLMLLQDVVLGLLILPLVRKHWKRYHESDIFKENLRLLMGGQPWSKKVGETTEGGPLLGGTLWTNVGRYQK